MGRAYVDHATGVRLDPTALAPAAGKFDNVQFVTVDHRHHQVAVVRDRFIGADVAPHAMAFRTQRKFRIDVEQNACASDVQLIMPWEAGRLVLRFLRGKVRGGRLASALAVRSTTSCWRRRPRARVDADQSEERADVSEIFSVAQSHPPPRGKRELFAKREIADNIARSNPRAGRSLMHGVAPQLCRSSSPPIVRRRSRGSLPRLHLSEDKRPMVAAWFSQRFTKENRQPPP